MSITGLAFFALVYFIFVVTPGPGVAAMIARGLGTGTKGAWPYAMGFMLGDMTWFTVAAAGLGALATKFALAFMIVKYAGCLYLAYLAWKIWRAPARGTMTRFMPTTPNIDILPRCCAVMVPRRCYFVIAAPRRDRGTDPAIRSSTTRRLLAGSRIGHDARARSPARR